MAINLKSISHFSWPQWSVIDKFRVFPWKSVFKTSFQKVLTIIFLILFLVISLLFLCYAIVEITTNTAGVNAQVADISSLPNKPLKKYRLSCETFDFYKVAVIKDHVEYRNVICLYTGWPNHVEPVVNNLVKVWPPQKPLIAATLMGVQGWIVSVFFLIAGLAIIINFKSIFFLLWPPWVSAIKWGDFSTWKSLLRVILLKVLVIILSILFLVLSLLFFGYAFIEITTNTAGVNAQVADISSLPNITLGKHRLRYETVGLFKATVIKDNVKYDVICLYPAWPNHVDPAMENMVKVWPEKKPLIAATQMQVLGWVVSIFFLIVGLAMFEFFLLAWTIH